MKKYIFGTALAISAFAMPLAVASGGGCYPVQCDPCCDDAGFDGFYIGGNLGVFSHTAYRNDLDGFLTDNGGWGTIGTSFTAGVQLGYDWQWCSSLVGIVADWNWVDTDRRIRDNINADDNNFVRNQTDWFTTIRARAGLTVNDALVYVTLGAAVTRFDTRWQDLDDTPDAFRDHHTRWGWVGGAGAEFLVWCNWSLGLEVLFLQFSEHTRTFTTAGGTAFAFGHSDSAWVGRFLLNYRFGDLCSWGCN